MVRPAVAWATHRRFRASVSGMRIGQLVIGPEDHCQDPHRQSARTRADQLELPPAPPNDDVEVEEK